MPARHRRSSLRPMGSARRRTTWATHQSTEVIAAANDLHTISLFDSYAAAGGSVVGVTVGRTLLHLAITAPAAGPAAGRAFTIGLIRGQSSDVGTNIAGAPHPDSDFYEDWAWLEQFDASSSTGAGPTVTPGGGNVVNRDIRSKRKLPELHMNWNLALVGAQAGMSIVVYSRTLILLP